MHMNNLQRKRHAEAIRAGRYRVYLLHCYGLYASGDQRHPQEAIRDFTSMSVLEVPQSVTDSWFFVTKEPLEQVPAYVTEITDRMAQSDLDWLAEFIHLA